MGAMTSLVTITMPCFNSRQTLPMALASLLAQDYENWECVLVDDGSTDNPREIVEQANDPRIRYFRFEENRGRGVARQEALDRARGDYLAMLDADDWLYPSKIGRQLDVMRDEPDAALVSAGMAIVDEENDIVGVRCTGASRRLLGLVRRLRPPPVAHAPSMIRMEVARQCSYDAELPEAEDVDFLLRLMLERRHCVLPEVSYVYAEHASVTPEKILRGHRLWRRILRKHSGGFPLASRTGACWSLAKSALCRCAFAAGLAGALLRRRSRRPTPEEADEFRAAREAVLAVRDRAFGPDPVGAGPPAGAEAPEE